MGNRGRRVERKTLKYKPIKRGIEAERFGIIREIGDFVVARIVVELKVHGVNRSAAFFPELILHAFHRELKREANIGVEGFEIGMSDPQHHRVVPMELDAGRHPLPHHFLLFLFTLSLLLYTILFLQISTNFIWIYDPKRKF